MTSSASWRLRLIAFNPETDPKWTVTIFRASVRTDTCAPSLGYLAFELRKVCATTNRQEDSLMAAQIRLARTKAGWVFRRFGISMFGLDLDFWGHVTLAAVFILGVAALIACVFVLGLVLLHSWEAESLLHCSPWSSSSSPCGRFF
jgi:hypothetical protein